MPLRKGKHASARLVPWQRKYSCGANRTGHRKALFRPLENVGKSLMLDARRADADGRRSNI